MLVVVTQPASVEGLAGRASELWGPGAEMHSPGEETVSALAARGSQLVASPLGAQQQPAALVPLLPSPFHPPSEEKGSGQCAWFLGPC